MKILNNLATRICFYVICLIILTGCTAPNVNHTHNYVEGICSCGEVQETLFKVSFVDYNGDVIKEVEVKKNSSVEAPSDPIREGYEFTGWSTTFNNITSDLVVVAQYNIIEQVVDVMYKVTFVDFNGNILKEQVVKKNSSVEAPSDPTRDGYEFTGWSTTFDNIISDLVVVAQYKLIIEEDTNTSVSNVDDFLFFENTVIRYCGTDSIIKIPSSYEYNGEIIEVTNIGSDFLYSDYDSMVLVEKIIVPGTIKTISENAFSDCYTLREVIFEEGVEEIQRRSFDYCINLHYVSFPSTLKKIEYEAFAECESLFSLIIPQNVEFIDEFAFANCSNLYEIYNLSNVEVSAVKEEKEDILDIYSAFIHTSLDEPSIYTVVNNDFIFRNVNGVYTLVKYIGKEKDIILPDLYNNDDVLTSYIISNDFISYPMKVQSIEMSDCVVQMESYAFNRCINLNKIYLSNNLKSFESSSGFRYMEYVIFNEFEHCKYLGTKTNPYFLLVEADEDVNNVVISESTVLIYESAFYECSNLTSIVIPNSVTSIGDYAFYGCSSLTSIEIPDSVTSIGDSAFASCDSLTSIVIPNSVTSIGYATFSSCDSLTSIVIPNSVTSIGNSAFGGCGSLTSIVIPNSVTSIGYASFSGCSSLTSITIPDSVTSIEGYAFGECSSLTIYCEATTKPSEWFDYWNPEDCLVVWGYTID